MSQEIIVKTFDMKLIKKLIAKADSRLQTYIFRLTATLERQAELTALAVKKLKDKE